MMAELAAMRQGLVAQISTYPMDLPHVEHLLPHQIKALADMVDRIVITIDTHQSRSGRYRGTRFAERLDELRRVLTVAQRTCPKLHIFDVDYSEPARRAVAQYFFGTDTVPIKAWDGGPFYSYFFGLFIADAQYVMHLDGDILFGGGSLTWMNEAIEIMQRHRDVLVMAPFPGPPRADGQVFGHQNSRPLHAADGTQIAAALRHDDVSTRIFMIDLNRFKTDIGTLPLLQPTFTQRVKSRLLGNSPEALEAEVLLSKTLQNAKFGRIDYLGSAPGLWTLHPPYRSEEFYRRLPDLVSMVESGAVPEGQRGHYDVNDSMVDWRTARADNHWSRRYLKMIRHRLASLG